MYYYNHFFYRPQFLVLTGPPSSRPDLVYFSSHMSHDVGIMVCGQVLLVSDIIMNVVYSLHCTD